MARNSQRACARRDTSSGPSRSRYGCRERTVWRYSICRTNISGGVDPHNLRDSGAVQRAISAFASSPNGGLIVTAAPLALVRRDLIITLAARHKLCSIYNLRSYVAAGGLIYYGTDIYDLDRRAAGYIDRVLKGEKPSDLPVQAPTKFETVINMKTAKALGITMPASLITRADEVIE